MIDLKYKPTITGDKVILRPFENADIEYIEECLQDPEVIKLTGSSNDFDKEKVRKWYITRNEQPDRLDLAIFDKSTNVVVGEVVIYEYDEANHSMNYRVLIGPRGRNRGLGTEATTMFINYIFANTDLNQLILSVYSFNPRAQRVYEKAGFVLENIDEAVLEHDGCMIDSLNMILTHSKWESRSIK